MSSASAYLSSSSRRLELRMRPDVSVHPLEFGGKRYWGVKDPVSLRYFQLREEEFFILEMLNGHTSLEEIQAAFEQRHAPRRVSMPQLQSFLGILHEQGLIVTDLPGQGPELLERSTKSRRREMYSAFSNVLALRFRGLDPETFLNWLYPRCRWLYSRQCVMFCLLAAVAALVLVAVQFNVLQSRLPGFRSFFSVSNLLWLAVALAVTKILHEIGHGLTCKHFGGECHEMGVMLLAFTPCLYCNVSDAWMIRSKWKRIAVSAAGMYVESVLATVCTFLWWFSEPGLLNAMCLNVMFICSVGTIVLNGNPLLRYDGYYILADFLEVPNLRQQASAVLNQSLARWFLGIELRHEQMLPTRLRKTIALYAVASMVYRWFVVLAILWFCHSVLKPYGLEVIAQLLAVLAVGGMLVAPVTQAVGFLRNPARRQDMKWGRLFVRGGVVVALVASLFLIRWPYRIATPAVVQTRGAQHVYVSMPGKLVDSVPEGTSVKPGEKLARLENHEVRLQVEKLRGQRDQMQLRLKTLESRQVTDDDAAAQIPATRERISDIEERLKRREADESELILTAPLAGKVLAPPSTGQQSAPGALPSWTRTPLDERNRGTFLETGTLFCLVGDPGKLESVLVIDQTDIKFVQTGQRVRIQFNHLPGTVLQGKILEIAEIDLKVAPRDLIDHEDLPTRVDETGRRQLLSTSYQARVQLDAFDDAMFVGAQGQAKIDAAPQSLASRLYRYLSRTFHFEL